MKNMLKRILFKAKSKCLILHFTFKYSGIFKSQKGIEIGGPSEIFKSNGLNIYNNAKCVDGVNFSKETIWEGVINKEGNFYSNLNGKNYIGEASDLSYIKDEQYDFLISSHCLEHCANAIKTINEWKRVVKNNGYLLIIVPEKSKTFDQKREITNLSHFISDFENKIDERDLSHLEEILDKHDLDIDIAAGTKENFKLRSINNYQNRCLHHHIFSIDSLCELLEYCDLKIQTKLFLHPYHNVVLCRKSNIY